MVEVDALFGGTPVAHSTALIVLPKDDEIDQVAAASVSGGAAVTEKLLASHKTAQLGEMGVQLNELLAVAKGLHPDHTHHTLVGKLMSAFHGEKEQLLAHTQSVKTRMDTLRTKIEQTAALHRQRIADLDGLKVENEGHLDQMIAGIDKLSGWEGQVDTALLVPPDTNNPHAAMNLTSLRHTKQRLATTIETLKNARELDVQRGLELQATQDNSRALLDEFTMAVGIAVPALEGLVAQQLIAIEQHDAARIDSELRGMISGAITQAAQTLGDNQVQIATMQNKPIIAMEDLEKAQAILEQSAEKVHQIETQGAAERAANEHRRAALEKRFLQ